MQQQTKAMIEINIVEDDIMKLIKVTQQLVEEANDLTQLSTKSNMIEDYREKAVALQGQIIDRLEEARGLMQIVRSRTKKGDL